MVAAKLYAHMMNGNRTLKQTEQGVILTQEDLIIQQNQQRKQYISKVKMLNFLTLMLFFVALNSCQTPDPGCYKPVMTHTWFHPERCS